MSHEEFQEVFEDDEDFKNSHQLVIENAKKFLKKDNQISHSQLLKSELNSIHKQVHVQNESTIKKIKKEFKTSFLTRDILSYEPKKLLIISLVPTILLCFFLFLWFNRYETFKYNIGNSNNGEKTKKSMEEIS